MAKKIFITLSVIMLMVLSSGCSSGTVMQEKSGRKEHMTLAESIESYIRSNDCGLLSESESVCFAGILTRSQEDHKKCSEISCN
jgi:hypothetical protein